MDFDPKERVLSFQVPDVCAKFRRNRFKTATVRARTHTHTHTSWHTHRDHTSDLI